MQRSRQEVQEDTITLLAQLAADWEWDGEITEQTRLGADLGLESLDVVVLGTAVQEHYKQVLPFPDFFAMVGQRPEQDITVGEWVDFVWTNLDAVLVEVSR